MKGVGSGSAALQVETDPHEGIDLQQSQHADDRQAELAGVDDGFAVDRVERLVGGDRDRERQLAGDAVKGEPAAGGELGGADGGQPGEHEVAVGKRVGFLPVVHRPVAFFFAGENVAELERKPGAGDRPVGAERDDGLRLVELAGERIDRRLHVDLHAGLDRVEDEGAFGGGEGGKEHAEDGGEERGAAGETRAVHGVTLGKRHEPNLNSA